MAGIGFVLRKLLKQESLTSYFQAYFHAIVASSGQWLMTILTLGLMFNLSGQIVSQEKFIEFRLIIIYNFAFSLIIAAPITTCATRYLADIIYRNALDEACGLMIGMLFILSAIAFPVSVYYYFFHVTLEQQVAVQAVVNFMLIAAIWHASIFITALKYYTGITFTFIIGMVLCLLGAYELANLYASAGMLAGFNLGLGYILASLIAITFVEYPRKTLKIFYVGTYFKRYWEIALGAFFYNIGLWIDKWIMWFAPEAEILPSGMRMYAYYDSSMFTAYLAVIPVMALFLLSQETSFSEVYVDYYKGIMEHDNLKKIRLNHSRMLQNLTHNGRNLLLLQFFICFMTILIAPEIFNLLGMNLIQIAMFRYGVLGASFQILTLFMIVAMSYFDYRKGVLITQTLFLVTNGLFSYISMKLGFPFYGYGYFLACVVTFVAGAYILERYIKDIPFHTFVTMNITTGKARQLIEDFELHK